MKTLIVRTGGLGDSILTLHCARCLKQQNPWKELSVLGNNAMLDVARLSGAFEGFRLIDESCFAGLYSASKEHSLLKTYFACFDEVYFYTTESREFISERVVNFGAGICSVLDPRPPQNWNRHISEHLVAIFDENPSTACSWFTNYDPILSTVTSGERHGLIIHPGSGGRLKNWPFENFLEVAGGVKMPVTFILGPAEIEQNFKKIIHENRFPVLCSRSITELRTILNGAGLYVGNDSGVSHLAALCGTPSIVLFGPTDSVVWQPLGNHVKIVVSDDKTMNGIRIEDVVKTIEYVRESKM
jgi:ADP-heptose:LPS heptosyltransferase